MNLTMYCDSEKNLLMFLPDGITDAEIMALGSVAFPDGDSNVGSSKVPTGIINLYDLHASFSLDEMTPNDIFLWFFSFPLLKLWRMQILFAN